MTTTTFTDLGLASLFLIQILTFIIEIVSRWLIFEKAGEKKYKCLIPFLSNYTSYKITGMKCMFYISLIPLALLLVSCIIFFGGFIGGDGYYLLHFCSLNVFLMPLAMFVISAIKQTSLSFVFGKKAGYALGLIFLRPIFMMILGVSNLTYKGIKAKPIKDKNQKSSNTATIV